MRRLAMSSQVLVPAHPTAKPVIAGVINIVIGACALLALSVLGVIILVVGSLTVPALGFLVVLLGVPLVAGAVLALVGGIYAVQRKMWGWALAGSIATALISNVLGVVSVVLVAVSKPEFANG
jgi:hypothetical protein